MKSNPLLPMRHSKRGRQARAISITLLISLALGGWLFARLSVFAPPNAAAVEPQASPSPSPILAKEYVYAGSKLVATEVPFLEADVSPRADGDGRLMTSDWTQTGNFAAGTETPNPGSEFQRADCAPRSSLGNGAITISDWSQAGRYSAGLDPPALAGGPTGSGQGMMAMVSRTTLTASNGRLVRIIMPNFVKGQSGQVRIELQSLGDENALGLSLAFDPSKLKFETAIGGVDAPNGKLNINKINIASGQLGIGILLPPGKRFSSGTRQVVVVNFRASGKGRIAVSSGDQPIWREIANVNGDVVEATFTP
jgi:hypothetical protein